MLAVPNHAKGYGGPAERPREMSERDYTSFGGGPSGGVVSNVSDMLRYLDFQLNGGRTADGTQLISGRQMHEMHSAQVIAAEYDGVPEIHTVSYGFGWYRQSYRGHVMLHHGGTGPGTTSWMVLLPERNIGIVVLSNRDLTPFPWALSYEIADLLLGLEARDWMARITTWNANRQKQSGPSTPRRQNGTAPSHLLEAYTGAYVHEGYGRFEIGIHNGLLQLITPVRVPLEHYHYDVYRMSTDLPLLQGRLLQFHSDVSGSITSISVRLEPAAEPVLFTRMD
jgi:CubicO group peptidase (beta-lactamase class C family)